MRYIYCQQIIITQQASERIKYTIILNRSYFGEQQYFTGNRFGNNFKLPVISNVVGKNISQSITLEWDASEDTASVQISQNGVLLATVNESTYVHSNLNKSTTYNYTLVPYNQNGLKGEAVSISLTTSSSSSSGGSSGGSSSSKSSSGGGGGGATSVEDLANVAVKDVNNQYLRINTNVTYEFARPGNDILSVSFYSLKNSGEITSTIEVLNNRSKLEQHHS
jgi:hypothetical protein